MKTSRFAPWLGASVLAAASLFACGGEGDVTAPSADGELEGDNPLLEESGPSGKEDSAYYNPDGIEVEVDLEGDVEASEGRLADGPAIIGQFALTYLRKTGNVYLESLAEQASSDERVEWLVNGTWITAREAASKPSGSRRHFRIRGINAVLLHAAKNGVDVGTVFTAPVPLKPYSVMADAGHTCAEEGDGHMSLDSSIYWYMWEPERADCTIAKQDLQITVSKMLPSEITYPEYDQLTADGKITAVILFGQIDDDPLTEDDAGFKAFRQFSRWLKTAKYTKGTGPVGERWSKVFNGVTIEVDLYSPTDFAGLSDSGNFANFQRALSEHEIVTYDGHSMLGASDFWTRPSYPSNYQIFLYGGCLGYEYYVAPIVAGKHGWGKLDIVSSVVEVSANANYIAGPFLSKLQSSLKNKKKASWKDYIGAIRTKVGDSTFGASGVRDNCWTPSGSRCTATPAATAKRYEDATATNIPDNSAAGVSRTITVPDTITLRKVTLELDVTHTYTGDLSIVLERGATKVTVWDLAGGDGDNIKQSFVLDGFTGVAGKGEWKLTLVDTAAQDTGKLNKWALSLE